MSGCRHTYANDAWLADNDLDIEPYLAALRGFLAGDDWAEPSEPLIGAQARQ